MIIINLFHLKKEELTALKLEQEEIGNSIENFAQALRQEANIQNLLDDEGREIARDSDEPLKSFVEETEIEIEDNLKKLQRVMTQKKLNPYLRDNCQPRGIN